MCLVVVRVRTFLEGARLEVVVCHLVDFPVARVLEHHHGSVQFVYLVLMAEAAMMARYVRKVPSTQMVKSLLGHHFPHHQCFHGAVHAEAIPLEVSKLSVESSRNLLEYWYHVGSTDSNENA